MQEVDEKELFRFGSWLLLRYATSYDFMSLSRSSKFVVDLLAANDQAINQAMTVTRD